MQSDSQKESPLRPQFDHLLDAHCQQVQRLVVGFSGGVDSTVLLHLAHAYAQTHNLPLIALYLHHGDAFGTPVDDWQAHSEQHCQRHAIPLHTMVLAIPPGNLENAGRSARYAAFNQFCQQGDLLLLAHHLDDQHETLLSKLARGASLHGLLIPQSRKLDKALLLRPLLSHSKQALYDYATTNRLDWIEDPGNSTDDNNRAMIRTRLVPVLAQIWPNFSASWHASETALAQAATAYNFLLTHTLSGILNQQGLPLANLKGIPRPVQVQLVLAWLRSCGCRLPGRHTLHRHLPLLLEATGRNTSVQLTAHTGEAITLRLYQRCLWLYCPALLTPLAENDQQLLDWDTTRPVALPGSTLSSSGTFDKNIRLVLGKCNHQIQVFGTHHHQQLRKIMQRQGIPAWERTHTPQCYWKGQLIALGDKVLCTVGQELQPCWQPHWRIHPQ